ncbi:MAG TPA: adenosylcobinamide-GDP ribazoletransferase [Ktedonobacteraceae bacterium]|nr:adenosylcobinamide-GDP ribazoletransferase [Ktedonobacteraceae bacterium]
MRAKRTKLDYSQYLMHSRARPSLRQRVREQLKELVAAIRFLSILPIPGSAQLFSTEDEDAAVIIGAAYFPFVGLLIALVLLALLLATSQFFPPLVLAAFLVVAQVVLTGGLHMDGLMDSSDGLFGGTSPERRLEIMRDSRVGSFGVLAGACVLLLKFALFATLRVHLLAQAVLMVLPAARWAMIMTVSLFPSARPTGLGAAFRQTLSPPRLVVAGITALIVVLVVGHLTGLLVLLVGTLAAVAVGAWATRRLGGLTGDSYGAIAEVAEVVMLLMVVVLNAWFF